MGQGMSERFPRCEYSIEAEGWIAPLGLGRRVRLDADLDFIAPGRKLIWIRAGYLWDGPSAGLLTDDSATFSLVHDWLYRHGDRSLWTRAEADALAMAIARDHGARWLSKPWHWALVSPVTRLAWAMRWGSWRDIRGRA